MVYWADVREYLCSIFLAYQGLFLKYDSTLLLLYQNKDNFMMSMLNLCINSEQYK